MTVDKRDEEMVAYVKREFARRMASKYRRGVEEHGGNLQDKPLDYLIEAAIDEAIDQVVYLLAAKRAAKNIRVGVYTMEPPDRVA